MDERGFMPGEITMSAMATKEIDAVPSMRFVTEDEFEAWCDEDTKAEYIDGEVIEIPPESPRHGSACTSFGCLLDLFVGKSQLGVVFATGKIQVRLRRGLRRSPDIVLVKNSGMDIVKEYYIDGAPDLVVEFVSPESAIRDWHEKYIEYEAAGVREYWLIDRQQQRAAAYCLGDDRRYHPIASRDGKLYSTVLPGFWIKLEWFWEGLLFDAYGMAREIGIIG
jgi:Uma2 family endonuclease